jgi:hypothetical protein
MLNLIAYNLIRIPKLLAARSASAYNIPTAQVPGKKTSNEPISRFLSRLLEQPRGHLAKWLLPVPTEPWPVNFPEKGK